MINKEVFLSKYKINREQTDSLKWDALEERFGSADLLPLWVADADFSIDDSVKEHLIERINHGAFGYSLPPKDYFSTYQGWQNRHEQTQFLQEWLFFSPGVVQSLNDLIACYTKKGEKIVIQPPVYYPFYTIVKNQERELVLLPLINNHEQYTIDFEKMEETFKKQEIHLFILCSPHNPVGRVWTADELTKFFQLCKTYDIRVISDEIHSDLILSPYRFLSSLTIAKEVGFKKLIVCNSPSKTFNFAGLLHSHIWIPDTQERAVFTKWSKIYRHTELSVMGQIAAKAAYSQSDEWLQGFIATIESNYQLLIERLHKEFPEVEISPLEGTYLAWINIDCLLNYRSVKQLVQEQAKLAIDFGEWFSSDYQSHIRINLATTPEILTKALDQLVAAVKLENEEIKL